MTTRDKQVFDLTSDDLSVSPFWYFPMDESVEDEMTVRPVSSADIDELGDVRLVARCRFIDALGRAHLGYGYPGEPNLVDVVQPVLLHPAVCVTFWNGPVEPSAAYLGEIALQFPPAAWPIAYEIDAVAGIGALGGRLTGIYYLRGDEISSRPVAG